MNDTEVVPPAFITIVFQWNWRVGLRPDRRVGDYKLLA
jgi:hypothetical protein